MLNMGAILPVATLVLAFGVLMSGGTNVKLPITPFLCDRYEPPNFLEKENCINGCSPQDFTGRQINVTFYSPLFKEDVIVCKCKKIKRSQTFTKTWTFSEIASQVTTEDLPVSWQECLSAWETSCGKAECNTVLQEITPEYYYASDHTVIETGVILDARKTTISAKGKGVEQIYVNGEFVKKSIGRLNTNDGLLWYLWNPESPSSCVLQEAVSSQCLISDRGTLLCKTLGIGTDLNGLYPISLCGRSSNLFMTREGIPFTYSSYENNFAPPPFPMLHGTETEEIESLITSIIVSESVRSSEDCLRSCLRNIEKGTPFGITYYGSSIVTNSTGYIKSCVFMPTCKLFNPVGVCPNSGTVKVQCGISTYWWNLTSLEIHGDDHCAKGVNSLGSALIRSGQEVYKVNESGIFFHMSEAMDPFLHLVPHSLMSVLDASDLKMEAVLSPKSIYSKSISKNNTDKVVSGLSWSFLSDIADFPGKVWHSITSGIRWLLFIIGLIACIVISTPIISTLMRKKKSYTPVFLL